MEPLFINQYARDEAVIKEIYRSYYLTPISIMFYFCAGISFIANLIFLLLNHAIYDTCAFLRQSSVYSLPRSSTAAASLLLSNRTRIVSANHHS